MEELDVVELFIDDDNEINGIEAISLVQYPAIEENFVALKQHKIEFKTIDEEKRIIIGLALVPDKKIFRKTGDYSYYIKFSKETVRKGAYMFLRNLKSNNTTLEHETNIKDVYVVETWMVDNPEMDKTKLYGLNAVEGAWAVIMSIENDKVWQEIKDGTYLGISVEGYFSDEQKLSAQSQQDELIEKIKSIITNAEINK